jgi:hypothetical protein
MSIGPWEIRVARVRCGRKSDEHHMPGGGLCQLTPSVAVAIITRQPPSSDGNHPIESVPG